MRIASLAFALSLALFSGANAQQATCDYCKQPFDTRTRVISVLDDGELTGTFYFDSLWHFREYLWDAEVEGKPLALVMAAMEDYAGGEAKPTRWVIFDPASGTMDDPWYVWSAAEFPGARDEPFVAVFSREADARSFMQQHGGELLRGGAVNSRMRQRFDAGQSPGGEHGGG